MLFSGDAGKRDKYVVLVSDAIHPKMPARSYLDRGPYECELKQAYKGIRHKAYI
jgi:hypothetical protein